jgi:Xaa-Pro aminopeptidase
MREKLEEALGPLSDRLVREPELALSWLGTRIEPEVAAYPTIVRMAHAIIDEAFSQQVITPGVTTSDDVRWFLRQRVNELGLDVWFHPSVNIQRADQDAFGIASMGLANEAVIQHGDFIHVDFGIVYLGLATDTQHHAYVLKPGETEAPRGLRRGLRDANRVQDILIKEFEGGKTGNDVFEQAYRKARSAGLDANIYSHPIGYHGHGAGPWIGTWENPERVEGRGDAFMYPNTAWSIELNAQREVPEWGGQTVRFMTEEDAYFDGEEVRFLDGRQTEITLIPRQN